MERIFLKEQIGLYRDNLTFKLIHDFKTEITTNLTEAYSVDETFNLINNTDCLVKTKQKEKEKKRKEKMKKPKEL